MPARWPKEQEEYLCENWGKVSISSIAQKLNRSTGAVINKARRFGLGEFLLSGEYISFNQLLIALGVGSYGYKQTSWLKNRNFPVHRKKVLNNTFRIVYIREFWKWAEQNRAFLDFSKMEPLALGKEPEWVDQQRKEDFKKHHACKNTPWTKLEDEKLTHYVRQHQYTYTEIAAMLRRTEGAVLRRCNDLNLKDRPVRIDPHGESAKWKDEHYPILADGIRNGESYFSIAQKLGKSEKAVKGKVYVTYLTENADKVRAMLGNGEWGHGAPPPTVKQAKSLSGQRSRINKDLSALVTVLRYRMNELGYEPYWQRTTCTKWDDIKGCLAGNKDCDSCADYQRIRPQYCFQCGKTFLEKEENKFCPECRVARKKQAQRKWARLNQKGA